MSFLKNGDARRPAVQPLRSFSRPDSTFSNPNSPTRTRASTISTPIVAVPEAKPFSLSPEEIGRGKKGDVFENSEESFDPLDEDAAQSHPELQQPEALEQLPIEIQTLTDRFLKSLSAKSHAAPLAIDAISGLFQDFYEQAESHINTHIATLTTRLSREKSSASPASSKTAVKAGRAGSSTDYDSGGEQQMLTASEITNKRKARKQLEVRRLAMEEVVEKGVCEKVYHKIYRHRSTDDEERDFKLRSKTAALSLVGIGLKELHVSLPATAEGDGKDATDKKVNELLAPARESIQRMDAEHYPLGKMQHLKEAHKSIVETLSYMFPSSSSADEVLPTLIYTLITSPPEKMNVASNLHFIQLFRASDKVDGEAAYCLVNLEAAISFLETVDLSSLRVEESPQGPKKPADVLGILSEDGKEDEVPSRTSLTSSPNLASNSPDELEEAIQDGPASRPVSSRPVRPTHAHQRRLSHLLQQQADRLEAGRENFLNSADEALDSINSTLENSFKYLFGRFKQQESESDGLSSPVVMPKTLDDARKLMATPPPEEEDAPMSDASSVAGDLPSDPLSKPDGKLLELVGGRRNVRDPSVDSTRSAGSGKKVAFITSDGDKASSSGPADSVGNFVNSLNPLSRFGVGVPSFAKFGRSASGPAPLSTPPVNVSRQIGDRSEKQSQVDGKAQSDTDLSSVETLAQLRKTKPPMRKFMEAKDARDLKIGDVDDLLKDYKRLAEALREAMK